MLKRRLMTLTLGVVTSFVLASFFISTDVAGASSNEQAGTQFTVLAGYEDITSDGLEVEAFLPGNITINIGDTVKWDFTRLEPHTVTFLARDARPDEFVVLPDGKPSMNPIMTAPSPDVPQSYDGKSFVNSGFPPPGADESGFEFTLTFSQPGTFPYVCLLHRDMTGTITVLPVGGPPVLPQEVVSESAQDELAILIEQLRAFRELLPKTRVLAKGGGRNEHFVRAGISTGKMDLMHFDGPEVKVVAGDTVTWTWEQTVAPHNVLFIPADKEIPAPFVVEPQAEGPAALVLNPDVFAPSGGDAFRPDRMIGSGVRFGPGVDRPPGFASGSTYSLVFARPGTYAYICSLHAAQGMGGIVTVAARSVTPSVGGVSPNGAMLAIVAMVGIGLVAAGAVKIRHSSVRRRVHG